MTAKTISYVERLAAARALTPGRKVRAPCSIFSYTNGVRLEVEPGTIGEVVELQLDGALLLVRWPGSKFAHRTSFDTIEIVEEPSHGA